MHLLFIGKRTDHYTKCRDAAIRVPNAIRLRIPDVTIRVLNAITVPIPDATIRVPNARPFASRTRDHLRPPTSTSSRPRLNTFDLVQTPFEHVGERRL